MDEEVPDKQRSPERPTSNLLSGAWKTKRVTTHHLESNLATLVAIVVCFIAAHMYKNRKAKKNENSGRAGNTFHRSLSLASLHGGETAMQRMLDAQHARVNPTALVGAKAQLENLLEEYPLDFSTMQKVLVKLEMSGEETRALEMLRKALEKAIKNERNHEAYELEMMIVEMLIYKGDYTSALKCKCLEHREISDARRPLYEAIIQLMLENKESAAEFWNEFHEIRSLFKQSELMGDASPISEISNFEMFQNVVYHLKLEVEATHGKSQ